MEQAAAQPGSQEHSRPRPRGLRARPRPGTDPARGVSGPLPQTHFFKAVRSKGWRLLSRLAPRRGLIPAQAALPRPVPKQLISTTTAHGCLDATRPWDGQTDTRLSCGSQAHPVPPSPTGEGRRLPRAVRPGVLPPRKRRAGDPPPWPGAPAPSLPSRPPGAHQLHASIDEFLKTWSGRGKLRRPPRSGPQALRREAPPAPYLEAAGPCPGGWGQETKVSSPCLLRAPAAPPPRLAPAPSPQPSPELTLLGDFDPPAAAPARSARPVRAHGLAPAARRPLRSRPAPGPRFRAPPGGEAAAGTLAALASPTTSLVQGLFGYLGRHSARL